MKKIIILTIFLTSSLYLFSQQVPTVAVATFDVMGGVTADESKVITELFITEIVSKGTVNVVERENFDKIISEMRFQSTDWSNSQKTAQLGTATNAQYVIRGQFMKMGNVIYWTSTMIDVNTAQVLYSAREQISDLKDIWGKLPGFCSQILAKIPAPNYFIGKWRGVSGTRTCILEFKTDGSIIISEYQAEDFSIFSTQRKGRGTGNYSLNGNNIRINLTLKGLANVFKAISVDSLYTFDESKNGFILSNGLLCYNSSSSNYYSSFVKIQ